MTIYSIENFIDGVFCLMGVLSVIIIGIALSMDAFGVSVGVGVLPKVDRKIKIGYIISFGFFQFFFTFLGGALGYLFDTYIASIPNVAGGVVIVIIGILMILDSLKRKEESILVKESMIIILGISVSIDALIIGFTAFHLINNILLLFVYSLLVGLITLCSCTIAFFFCRYIRKIKFISKYADLLGGIALIILAIKMIFF